MNDERRPPDAPRHQHDQPLSRVSVRPARVTGLQVIQAETAARFVTWRELLSPREYAVALDLVSRMIGAELRRNDAAQGRFAA
jgi:hypothetical protein